MKKFIVLIFLYFVVNSLWGSHHTATSLNEPFAEPGLRLAFITEKGDFDFLFDLNGSSQGEGSYYHSLSAGAYYRLHRNLKAGIFYMTQAGARHDEDWVEEDGDWSWKDTDSRYEQILTGDFSPRFLIAWLPGKNSVFTLKNRYSHNFTNGQQSYMLLPGLTWFYIRDRSPVYNINVGYGLYFPLNYSDSLVYRQGPWLSGIYHFSAKMKLEITGNYLITNWTVQEWDGGTRINSKVTTQSLKIGLGLIFKLN